MLLLPGPGSYIHAADAVCVHMWAGVAMEDGGRDCQSVFFSALRQQVNARLCANIPVSEFRIFKRESAAGCMACFPHTPSSALNAVHEVLVYSRYNDAARFIIPSHTMMLHGDGARQAPTKFRQLHHTIHTTQRSTPYTLVRHGM